MHAAGIYKGGTREGGKILAGFSLPSTVLPCHILLPSPFLPDDYRPLSPPTCNPPLSLRDTFSTTTTPLMKFLYYFNKRYLPLSDRCSSVAALCSGTRFNSTSLRHFRENAPAYVSSYNAVNLVASREKRYFVSVPIYLTGIDASSLVKRNESNNQLPEPCNRFDEIRSSEFFFFFTLSFLTCCNINYRNLILIREVFEKISGSGNTKVR